MQPGHWCAFRGSIAVGRQLLTAFARVAVVTGAHSRIRRTPCGTVGKVRLLLTDMAPKRWLDLDELGRDDPVHARVDATVRGTASDVLLMADQPRSRLGSRTRRPRPARRLDSTRLSAERCYFLVRRLPPCQSSTMPVPSGSTPKLASCGRSRRLRLSSAKPGKVANPITLSQS